jgi:subtilisin family serine protease
MTQIPKLYATIPHGLHPCWRAVALVPRLRRLAAGVSIAVLSVATMTGAALAQTEKRPDAAPVLNEKSPAVVPGQFIVVFEPGTSLSAVSAAEERVKALGGRIMHAYRAALVGFSVELPREGDRAKVALDLLRSLPKVAYLEAAQLGWYDTIQPPNPVGAPPTGLDRIDRRLLPLESTYTYSETGAGVNAYVIDSGIRITHAEFSGRAANAFSVADPDFSDCFNHGTHVAGTIGGETFGVAKDVSIFNVRVGSAGGCSPTTPNVIAGVDWVTANHVSPAVANVSIGTPPSVALDTSLANSVAAGVTYAVSAGNSNVDGCGQSPGRAPQAITVGWVVPATDARAGQSNFGPCLDLFAPGNDILSASNASDTASQLLSGTSMASPHVAGVAARFLETHPFATPAAVWAAIHNANNVATTAGWGGVVNPGAGSPNELLHYGSLNDGFTDGDPHVRTTDGIHYDFQSAGEFTLLRDGNGLEIQVRQTPVSTQPPIANAHTGLASCVSLNTALAARVGGRRVSYQPSDRGMVLRIDGTLTPLTAQGVNLGPGARVAATAVGNGVEIDFPDGTSLAATPHFWGAPHDMWYLNVSVFRTPASEGVMGDIAPGSWLPRLPNNASVGPMPTSLAQRFVDLYQTFADAWRVDDATSLFDYGAGESTATFADRTWPPQGGTCVIPGAPIARPVTRRMAVRLCRGIRDKNRNANCVFDVAVTGERGFAESYLVSQQIEAGATSTTVSVPVGREYGAPTRLIAAVALRALSGRGVPVGSVQFLVDGVKIGAPVKLNRKGQATLEARIEPGKRQVEARFAPSRVGTFLPSSSLEAVHLVGRGEEIPKQR